MAVLANDALGNFVACTPLLQMIRAQWRPSCLDFFGGERTQELECASDLIDARGSLFGLDVRRAARGLLERAPYDVVVNLEGGALARAFVGVASGESSWVVGPALNAEGRGELAAQEDGRGRLLLDSDWTAADLVERYPFLESGFIGEIWARLAYLEGPLPAYEVACEPAGRAVPPVLVSAAASLSEKLWPTEKWREVLGLLRSRGLLVGLLGAKPRDQARYWTGGCTEESWVQDGLVEDLRGVFRLPQVVGALREARLLVSLDNGVLHLAAAAGTPTVGLFRHGIHRLWAPPVRQLTVLTPGEGRAVEEIPVEAVWEAASRAL